MRVYRIRPDGGNSCCEAAAEAITEWLEEAQQGDTFIIDILEMSLEEYQNLPEYMGP